MTFRLRLAACAAALLAMTPAAFAEGSFSDAQKKELGEIVRQYLLENPEVLLDVSKALEAKQQQAEAQQRAQVLQSNADQIFRSPNDYVAGNPKGDVTIVEFFDYRCPYCKQMHAPMKALLKEFGPSSASGSLRACVATATATATAAARREAFMCRLVAMATSESRAARVVGRRAAAPVRRVMMSTLRRLC